MVPPLHYLLLATMSVCWIGSAKVVFDVGCPIIHDIESAFKNFYINKISMMDSVRLLVTLESNEAQSLKASSIPRESPPFAFSPHSDPRARSDERQTNGFWPRF